MGGTRARAGEIAGAGGVALGVVAVALGAPALGFGLALVGAAAFSLATSVSLNLQVAAGFLLGALAGGVTGLLDAGADGLQPVRDVGWLFIQLLKMLVGPLVFLAISAGLARSRSARGIGALGARTLGLYLGTMAVAIATGLVFVNLLEPGTDATLLEDPFFRARMEETAPAQPVGAPVTFRGFFGQLLDNPLASLADPSPPILALVFFALILGIALVRLGDRAAAIGDFLESAYQVVLEIISWFVRLAPIGVLAIVWSLVASLTVEGSLGSALRSLGAFVGVVFLATSVHAFVTLPAFAWVLGGMPPARFLSGISEALMVAFSTSSSAATLPVTTRNVEANLGVPPHVSSFVLPLGSTVNMDGTALYEAIAALFIAELYGIDLSLGSQLVVFGMSMLMAVGAPAIPSAGMVTMIAVLQSVNLPGEAVALLIPIDRLLDTIRTMANVEGDAAVAVCVARTSR